MWLDHGIKLLKHHWVSEAKELSMILSYWKLSKGVRRKRPCCLFRDWELSKLKQRRIVALFLFCLICLKIVVLSKERLLLCFVFDLLWRFIVGLLFELKWAFEFEFCLVSFELRIENQGRPDCLFESQWSSLS